jgi:rRNA-processing protein FCF1
MTCKIDWKFLYEMHHKTLFDPNKLKKTEPSELMQQLKETYQFIAKEEKRLKSLEFEARLKLMEKYDIIIFLDFKLAIKYDLEARKWKYCVHQLISNNRDVLKQGVKDSNWKSYLLKMIQNYKEMYQKLKERFAKHSYWSRLHLRIGDLYRYFALYLVPDSEKLGYWLKAKQEYTAYSVFVPGNGLVWNQLGIVAAVEKQYLIAAKLYLYSLTVPKSFENGRESLLELFHLISTAPIKNSLLIKDVDDIKMIAVERHFGTLQQIIFTKVGLDQFQYSLEEFMKSLQELQALYELEKQVQAKWWFELAMISITNACAVIRSRTFDQTAKDVLLGKSFDAAFVILTFGLTLPDQTTLQVFVEMLLLWIAICGSVEPFKKHFDLVWQILEYRYPLIEPVESKVDDVVKAIKQETGDLPEDSLYRECVPFMLFASETMISLDSFFEYSEQRTKRIQTLLGFLIRKKNAMEKDAVKEVAKGKAVHEPIQDAPKKVVYTFQEFEQEELIEKVQAPPKKQPNHILNELVEIEDSEEVKLLKSRKDALESTIQEKQAKSTLKKGKTILVFDTNLMLGAFEKIQSIIESKEWYIVIPLAVVTEIIGLNGNETSALADKATKVYEYVELNFKNHLFTVRSTKGKLVRDLRFNEEWDSSIRSADDAILETCRSIENTCLVTDDRNLRLKATTSGIFSIASLNKL